MAEICEHCGVALDDSHGFERYATKCFPKQITTLQAANKKLEQRLAEKHRGWTEEAAAHLETAQRIAELEQDGKRLEKILWELEQHGHPCECIHCEEWWDKYREARDKAMAKKRGVNG